MSPPSASARLPFLSLSGRLAWLVWLGVHLYYLSGFQNRILSVRWAWSLFTGSRGSRLIMRPHTAIGSLPLLGDLGGAGWPVENVEADRRSSA